MPPLIRFNVTGNILVTPLLMQINYCMNTFAALILDSISLPLDTGRKFNVQKTF